VSADSHTELTRLSDEELRTRLSALVAEYSARVQAARLDGATPAEPLDRNTVTPTDVVLTARQMLDTFDIAAFELGMLG
jgi:ATP-dependent helicase YprA (DUF1998 family)